MLFNFENEPILVPEHQYSFASTGIKTRSKVFPTREAANKYMYKLCNKNGLQILETWNDHHDKTYCCSNGIKFYIQRV